jgi:hypothetical protein
VNYKLTTPCNACPFLIGSGFTYRSLKAHASGEFGCHKACDLNDETSTYEPHEKTPHCAGALIFLKKQNAPHQMMRICERLGIYDRTKLNMDAPVVSGPADCRGATGEGQDTPSRERRSRMNKTSVPDNARTT